MKKITYALIAAMILVPALSFAQTKPQAALKPQAMLKPQAASKAPAAWVDFLKQQKAKKLAFYKELKTEKEAFIKSHPDVKAYLDQMHKLAREHSTAWKTAHP